MKPFEYIVEVHGPAVFRFLTGRVGPDRAEDCFQETMLAALRGYGEVREPKAVKSWLFIIATRKSIDAYRSAGRQPVPDGSVEEAPDPSALAQPGDSDVWSVVGQLPEKQALAVELRYRAGLSHREVGQVMEISESAARRNVFEGLKRLREGAESWT
ncbi:MAG: sigma-70 family RNA polymerase sigma factor [Thermoleophilia bacterium]|nr:sigma-70 family RNA polymerase sigma factor [Thermoleophilia bacterium]